MTSATSATSELLISWELYATVGSVMVIVGVAGEGVEIAVKFLEKRNERLRAWYERHALTVEFVGFVFWVMVVIGLMMEWRGNQKSTAIKEDETAELTKELILAKKRLIWLDSEIRPRSLLDITNSANNLSRFRNIKFSIAFQSPSPEGDADEFALNITAALNFAGWHRLPSAGRHSFEPGPVEIAILLSRDKTNDLPRLGDAALALEAELFDSGASASVDVFIKSQETNHIDIVVPAKSTIMRREHAYRRGTESQLETRIVGITVYDGKMFTLQFTVPRTP